MIQRLADIEVDGIRLKGKTVAQVIPENRAYPDAYLEGLLTGHNWVMGRRVALERDQPDSIVPES